MVLGSQAWRQAIGVENDKSDPFLNGPLSVGDVTIGV
jgi:hypothetical protein